MKKLKFDELSVVEINHPSYLKGLIGKIVEVRTNQYSREKTMYEVRITTMSKKDGRVSFTSMKDVFSAKELKVSVPKHDFICPLRVGDQILINDILFVHFKEDMIRHTNKWFTITSVMIDFSGIQLDFPIYGGTLNGEFYIWFPQNINIPETNKRLLNHSPILHETLPLI